MQTNNDEKIFNENNAKAAKTMKKLFLYIFGGMGVLFCILGLILGSFVLTDLYFFCIFGAVMALLGVLLYVFIPEKYNYDKYKKRVNKYGYLNFYDISATVASLKAENEDLKKRVTDLENKVNNK